MSFTFWLACLKARVVVASARRNNRKSQRATARPRRLLLETLEDRLVPAMLTVTSALDPTVLTAGTLRYAVSQANADANVGQSDAIVFSGVSVITLLQGQLELSGQNGSTPATITVDPIMADGMVTIDGNNASRAFQVDSGVQASIVGLTIQNGNASDLGGGILNYGTLMVSNSVFSGNSTGGSGGGIENLGGALMVSNSTFSDNSAEAGGGICNDSPLAGSEFGSVTISNSTFSDNTAYGGGGGIENNGTLMLSYSTLSDNAAEFGGGIYNTYTLLVNNSTLSDNTASFGNHSGNGGGINTVNVYPSAIVTISNSTLVGNSANGDGGGISIDAAPVTVNNCTLVNNSAGALGGGIFLIYPNAILTVTNSTLANNSAEYGGGIGNDDGAGEVSSGKLTNTIVANSTAGGDLYGSNTTFFGSYDLIGDGSYFSNFSNSQFGTLVAPLDPKLETLAKNGGPTQTMALQGSSPALGRGITETTATFDQRGFARPINSPSDIGAFQSSPLVGPLVVNTTADSDGPGLLTLRDAVNIADADTTTNARPITFDPMVFASSQTITLTGGTLTLGGSTSATVAPITITGPSAGVTISGANSFTVFTVEGSTTATLSGLTITNGNAGGANGGGIDNYEGTVTVSNSTISYNSAEFGGGIYNYVGTVTVSNSTLSGNSANGVEVGGGGIYNYVGTVMVSHSTLSDNSAEGRGAVGGGIANVGMLILSNSTFSYNSTSTGNGGCIYNDGSVTVSCSNLSDNSAGGDGGAIYNDYENSGTLLVSNSTLSDNSAAGNGGGINSYYGSVTVITSTLSGNAAYSEGGGYNGGGGIYNYGGTLTVNNSTLSSDSANSEGGAIANYYGPLIVNNSTLSNNSATYGGSIANADLGSATINNTVVANSTSGGAIYNTSSLTVGDSTFSGNIGATFSDKESDGTPYSTQVGSGIGNYNGGVANVSGSTFSNNTGSAIFNDYDPSMGSTITTVMVSGSTFFSNSAGAGGGILNYGGMAEVNTSTFTDNSASGLSLSAGGGIDCYKDGTLTVSNSTFSDNKAGYNTTGQPVLVISTGGYAGFGGGIGVSSGAEATVINSTFSGNSAYTYGGGIFQFMATLTVANTIIAGNTAGNTAPVSPDVFGGVTSKGYNLIGNNSGSSGFGNSGDLVGTASNPINPLLAPLGDYGGLTQTLALLPGSPAIDAGSNSLAVDATGHPLTTDQRGQPRIVGSAGDIGAFESQGFTLTATGGNNQSATVDTNFVQPLTVTVTANNSQEPVNGGVVTFTAPSSAASALLSANTATISSGSASVMATANDALGDYAVNAVTTGAPGGPAVFSLTNTITAAGLQQVLSSTTNPVTIEATPNTAAAVMSAIEGVTVPQNTSVNVYLNLVPGSYTAQTVDVPSGMTLYISGTPGTTIDPTSPAFTVATGNVVVSNVTFVTTGDAPTILVTGGSLILRNDTIQESTGFSDAAISVTGGTVDLGTATDSGGNTLNINGTGAFIGNTTANRISAVGDTFERNGQGTVWPGPLTVTTDSSLMLAGNNPPPLTGSVNGTPFTGSITYTTVWGDQVTITLSTTATSASSVGQYAVIATLSGASANNYVINPATSTNGSMYLVSVGADPASTTGAQAVTFWDNKGNAKLITAADLSSLDALNLVTQGGSAFDPKAVQQLQSWLSVSPNATTAYQLAVQLAAMDLNVLAGYVKTTDLVFAGGLLPYAAADNISGLTGGGFIDVQDLMQAANAALAQVTPGAAANDPNQAYEAALAQVLQAANGNTDFVQQELLWNLLGL